MHRPLPPNLLRVTEDQPLFSGRSERERIQDRMNDESVTDFNDPRVDDDDGVGSVRDSRLGDENRGARRKTAVISLSFSSP